MKALVLVLLTVAHLEAYCHSALNDECIVKSDDVEIATFSDSVAFSLAAISEDKDVELEIRQETTPIAKGKTNYSLSWMRVVLNLTSQPRLLVDEENISLSEEITLVRGVPKYIAIKNAYVLEGCPEGLPTRILDDSITSTEIPMSREEVMLILKLTQDMNVAVEVNQKKQFLCWDSNSHKPVILEKCDDGQHSLLKKDTPIHLRMTYETENVTFKVWGDKVNLSSGTTLSGITERTRLKIISSDASGLVSIVQCLTTGIKESGEDCGEDDGSLTWLILKVLSGVLLVVLIQFFLNVYLCCKFRRKRRRSYKQHKESSEAGFQQERGSTSAEAGVASDSTGVVDTWNELYVSSDALGLQVNSTHLNTQEQQV